MSHSAASDLGLHCLPMSLLWEARPKWVKSRLDHYLPDRIPVDPILVQFRFKQNARRVVEELVLVSLLELKCKLCETN